MKTSTTSLIDMLGSNREDVSITSFINSLPKLPKITFDKEDGADDEFVESFEQGVTLYFEKGILLSLFLKSSRNNENYSSFKGELPLAASFGMSMIDVVNIAGPPNQEGGGKSAFGGTIPPWIKYNYDGYSLHFEFTIEGELLNMVTLEYES